MTQPLHVAFSSRWTSRSSEVHRKTPHNSTSRTRLTRGQEYRRNAQHYRAVSQCQIRKNNANRPSPSRSHPMKRRKVGVFPLQGALTQKSRPDLHEHRSHHVETPPANRWIERAKQPGYSFGVSMQNYWPHTFIDMLPEKNITFVLISFLSCLCLDVANFLWNLSDGRQTLLCI